MNLNAMIGVQALLILIAGAFTLAAGGVNQNRTTAWIGVGLVILALLGWSAIIWIDPRITLY